MVVITKGGTHIGLPLLIFVWDTLRGMSENLWKECAHGRERWYSYLNVCVYTITSDTGICVNA